MRGRLKPKKMLYRIARRAEYEHDAGIIQLTKITAEMEELSFVALPDNLAMVGIRETARYFSVLPKFAEIPHLPVDVFIPMTIEEARQ